PRVEHDVGALRRDPGCRFEQEKVRRSGPETSDDPEDADARLQLARASGHDAQRFAARVAVRLPSPGPRRTWRTGGEQRHAWRTGSSRSNESASATTAASARARWSSAAVSSFTHRASSALVAWIRQAVPGI